MNDFVIEVVNCQLHSVIEMAYETEFVHQWSQRLIEPTNRSMEAV